MTLHTQQSLSGFIASDIERDAVATQNAIVHAAAAARDGASVVGM